MKPSFSFLHDQTFPRHSFPSNQKKPFQNCPKQNISTNSSKNKINQLRENVLYKCVCARTTD